MKKIHWCAGIILGFSIIAALLITSFEIAMYSDFDVYRQEYEKYDVLSRSGYDYGRCDVCDPTR